MKKHQDTYKYFTMAASWFYIMEKHVFLYFFIKKFYLFHKLYT